MRSTVCSPRRYGALTLFLTLAALISTLPAGAQDAPVRIAVVNLDFIVAQSPGGRDLQARLEQFQRDVQAQADVINAAALDIRQRMTDGVNTLSEEKLAELQKQLEDKQIELRRFRDDKQREGQKMQNEGLQQIERQLEPVFEKIRDEGGYDLILNNVPGVVVMAGPRVDITQKVVEALVATTAEE